MPFIALIAGGLLIVVALNNTQGTLAKQLEADLPGFGVWAAAIVVILALGYIPGLKTPIRWLLALIVGVLILTNYKQLFAQLQSFVSQAGSGLGQSAGTSNSPASQAGAAVGQALAGAAPQVAPLSDLGQFLSVGVGA